MDLAGKHEPAILKDWQVDPLSGNLLHVDLLRVAMDVRMRVKVPVHTFGEPAGVKQQGGVFEVVTREVEVECLPADIPTEFKVDVTSLMLDVALRAKELAIDTAKMKLLTDPERVLAHVVALKVEEEKPAEVVATEAATPAEPEVIKKGKKEVEGEEAAEGKAEAKPEKADKGRKEEVVQRGALLQRGLCGSSLVLGILIRSTNGRRITSDLWRWMNWRIAAGFASSGRKEKRSSARARSPEKMYFSRSRRRT